MPLPSKTKSKAEVIDNTCSDHMCEGKDTYRTAVRCFNCGWEGEMRTTVGHEPQVGRAIGSDCPRCEVSDLHKGDFIARDPWEAP